MSPVPKINRRGELESVEVDRIVGVPAQDPDDPEYAAWVLIRYLPEDVQRLVEEAANTKALPVWQLLLGYTMRCSEWGEIFAPHLLPDWVRGGKPGAARPCQGCGEMFISKFPSAAWCCNPCACQKLDAMGHSKTCPTLVHSGR